MAAIFTIKIKGLDETIKRLNNFSTKGLNTVMIAGLEKSSVFVLRVLKGNTPVDKGNLRDSMEKVVDTRDFKALIGPDLNKAYYAPFVELGYHHYISGRFIPGQHFIQKTGLETAKGVFDIFRQALNIQLNRDIG